MTCPRHDADACCPECPEGGGTDGIGFPHPRVAKGRRRLQRCPRCHLLVAPEWWVHDVERAIFACTTCAIFACAAQSEPGKESQP